MYLAHQTGQMFGDPTQNKKGGASRTVHATPVQGIKEIENGMGIFFNPQFTGRPGGKGNGLPEILNLEPVLKINGKKYVRTGRFHGMRDGTHGKNNTFVKMKLNTAPPLELQDAQGATQRGNRELTNLFFRNISLFTIYSP
jgi:hypothetical protein